MLARLKLATKLSLLVAFLVLATLVVGVLGAVSLRDAQATNAANLRLSAELTSAVESARAAEVAFKVQIQEFKNILLRGHDQQLFDRYSSAFEKRAEVVRKEFEQVQSSMSRVGLKTTALEDARNLHANIVREYTEALKDFRVGQPETSQRVDQRVRGKDRPLEEKFEALVDTVNKFSEKEAARLNEEAAVRSRDVILFLTVFVLLVAAAAAILGAVVVGGLLRQLGGEPADVHALAERIADGDLSVDVQVREGDTRSMVFAMRRMSENLRALVAEVADGARTVADSSAQIAQGNVDLSQRTEEQAGTLEETASQMEELTSTVTQNADNARQASQLAVGASDVARKGGQVVGDVVRTMTGISESSRRIAEIIGVIDGIAFQTNILALNAAVEAARAGEQGRGFAVVATEVRNLAQRSAAAAKEIKSLIGASVDQVEAGSKLVDAAGRTMDEIVGSVKRVSDLIAEIAAASQEQSAGIEQVNTAIAQMDQVVQQNASLVEEATAATESMKAQSAGLLQLVGRFRLGDLARNVAAARPVAAFASAASPGPIRYRPAAALPAQAAMQLGARPAADVPSNGHWREF